MKYLYIITFLFCSHTLRAQDDVSYHLVKVDFALGAAIPTGPGSKGGFLFALEPKLNIHPNLSLGLKMEFAGMARGATTSDERVFRGDIAYNTVIQPTFEFLLGTRTGIRPFAGVGVGYYNVAEARNLTITDVSGDGISQDDFNEQQLIGVMGRVGIESWHFRLGIEYTMLPKTGAVVNSYFGVKLGFFLGGGKK